MSASSVRRSLALAGLAFVLLDLVALFLPGRPPQAGDPAASIATTLAGHRLELMAGTYVAGLALVALILFLGALRSWLDRSGADPGIGFVACAGALLAVGIQLVGMVLFYGATFKVAGQHHDSVVRALTDGGNAAIELSKFGFAAFIGGVCLSARRELPARLTAMGWAAVALLAISAIALVSETAVAQFGGAVDLLGPAPAIVWIALLSVLVFRRPEFEGMPAAAAGSTA